MNLEKVDVVHVQTLERGVDGIEDCLTRETTLVDVVFQLRQFFPILNSPQTRVLANVGETFGENDELLTGKVVLLNGFAD